VAAHSGFLRGPNGRGRPREKGIDLDRGLAFPGIGGTWGNAAHIIKQRGTEQR
jgi:hypothetical protein